MDLRGFWKGPPTQIKPQKPANKTKKSRRKHKAQPSKPRLQKIGAPHPDYKASSNFYKSREWLEVRYLALKTSHGCCHCCGARASDGVMLHVDHIVPRYKAPHLSLVISNLQVLCEDCNMGKGAWDETDWRQHWKSI